MPRPKPVSLVSANSNLDDRARDAVGREAPGVALIVVGPEGIRGDSAVGSADLSTHTPMGTDLVMPWFSMTKIATATTVMRLVEREALELDAPVAPLVPALRSLRPSDWAARITIRHLLQHAGGLANPIPVKWIHPSNRPGPEPDAFLQGLLSKHAKLRFEPGTRSSYSNLGTLVLGAAIAHSSGRRYEEVAREEVLQPLGMSSTAYAFAAGAPAATGYHPRRSPMRLFLPRWVQGPSAGRWVGLRRFLLDGAAYGGLVGTPKDAARFLRMHLRDGELDGTRLISAEAAAQMRRIDKRGRRFDLGLGWFLPANRRDADPPYVEHLGGGAGFFNVMRMYPAVGVGAVVMGNSTKYDIDAVAKLALDFATPIYEA
jgi:CubicO group peptidase (beta-lactamase class C family)